jgi:hypothetical protein
MASMPDTQQSDLAAAADRILGPDWREKRRQRLQGQQPDAPASERPVQPPSAPRQQIAPESLTAAADRILGPDWREKRKQRLQAQQSAEPEQVQQSPAFDASTWLTQAAKSGVAFKDKDTAKEERILRDRFARHFPDQQLTDETLGKYREMRRVYGIARWINEQTPAGIGQREADEFARTVKPEDRQAVLEAVYELRAGRPEEEKGTAGKMNVAMQQGLQRLSSTVQRAVMEPGPAGKKFGQKEWMTDEQRVYARQLLNVVGGMNPVLEGDEPWYEKWTIQGAGLLPEMGAMVGPAGLAKAGATKLGAGKFLSWLAGAAGITAA